MPVAWVPPPPTPLLPWGPRWLPIVFAVSLRAFPLETTNVGNWTGLGIRQLRQRTQSLPALATPTLPLPALVPASLRQGWQLAVACICLISLSEMKLISFAADLAFLSALLTIHSSPDTNARRSNSAPNGIRGDPSFLFSGEACSAARCTACPCSSTLAFSLI